ncbi:MAG: threonine ammonia-lyase [Chthoniobacterales bacterium]|nr:threonine ammonia-lyase [Chthoniobacterales bacterium]
MPTVTIDDIRAARERIRKVIYHSPCPYSLSLSRLCGCEVYCKLDHLQMTGSFKERGARNKLMLLSDDERQRGIVAASAGNHALALAYHGGELGVPVTVVMPKWAPLVKLSNCRSFGANVILHGDSYDEARKRARELSEKDQLVYIPGFDDPDIISGQGTLGLEILEDVPDVDAVIVPIGGGGLIAGVGLAIKSLKPSVRIIGVEPANAPTYVESCKNNQVTHIETKPTLADGLAVAEVGKLCFEIARKVVDEVRLVDEAEIAWSVLKLLELEKTVVEGAGAVPLAAAADPKLDLSGKKVVLLLCGGNIDVTMISRVIERGLAVDGRLCRIVAQISDRPGGLARLSAVLATTGASIKEIDHDRHFGPADVAMVNVICTLETRDHAHIKEVENALADAGILFEVR